MSNNQESLTNLNQENHTDDTAIENAGLIAAAPDLLEALLELIEVLEAQPETDEGAEALAKAYAAVAKAESKTTRTKFS